MKVICWECNKLGKETVLDVLRVEKQETHSCPYCECEEEVTIYEECELHPNGMQLHVLPDMATTIAEYRAEQNAISLLLAGKKRAGFIEES